MTKKTKIRLDHYLVENRYSENTERAAALIMAGAVTVADLAATSPAMLVAPDHRIVVRCGDKFVSRGGLKLDAALESFNLSPAGKVCADVGAATGGFSDAMLQRGAEKVYAIDVGYGDLHWKVRSNHRVVPIERTNARYLDSLPEPAALVAVDASFISLALLLPAIFKWLAGEADIVLLVKPQFEAQQHEVPEGGVIEDPLVQQRVIAEVAAVCVDLKFSVNGVIESPIKGGQGNREFLLWASVGRPTISIQVAERLQELFY